MMRRGAVKLPRVPEVVPDYVARRPERHERARIGEREVNRKGRVFLAKRLARLAAELAPADHAAERKTRRTYGQRHYGDLRQHHVRRGGLTAHEVGRVG